VFDQGNIYCSNELSPYIILTILPNETSHTQPHYGPLDFVWDNPGELVPEETFTHSHVSWSSIAPYLLHPSTTIHGILPVQSTCLTVFFHNLSPTSETI